MGSVYFDASWRTICGPEVACFHVAMKTEEGEGADSSDATMGRGDGPTRGEELAAPIRRAAGVEQLVGDLAHGLHEEDGDRRTLTRLGTMMAA